MINALLCAMGSLHSFYFAFLEGWDGTIADAIGFYLSVEKSFPHTE